MSCDLAKLMLNTCVPQEVLITFLLNELWQSVFRCNGEVSDDFTEVARQMMHSVFNDFFRDATIIRFRDTSSNTGLRVAVATQRNGQTDDGLIVYAIHESHDGLGNASFTGAIEIVVRTYFFDCMI